MALFLLLSIVPQPRQPFSRNTSWKLAEGDRPEHRSLPLVCHLLYPTTPIGCPLANHVEVDGGDVVVGQRATFNSMGSQITCIHIAAFAVPVVFALISLTASVVSPMAQFFPQTSYLRFLVIAHI